MGTVYIARIGQPDVCSPGKKFPDDRYTFTIGNLYCDLFGSLSDIIRRQPWYIPAMRGNWQWGADTADMSLFIERHGEKGRNSGGKFPRHDAEGGRIER